MLTFAQAQHHELAPKGVKVQVVLPGTTRTAFWDKSGRASGSLPDSITMDAQDLVNAALAGLDQGEFVTIPSLPDLSHWHAFESARAALAPHLSRNAPAQRYLLNQEATS